MDEKKMVLRQLSYGLYAIGADDNGRSCGCIVNTVFQITSENPIIAVSMNKNNYTHELIERNGRFSVSILSEEVRREVINQLGFASGRDKDKFEGLQFHRQEDGIPVIDEGCCGRFICEVVSTADTPTHTLILARVEKAEQLSAGAPMTYSYYHEVLKGGAPKNAPSYIEPEKSTAGDQKERWICSVCGYVYEGDLTAEPDNFRCPICGVDKSKFKKEEAKAQTKERWICSVCGYVYEGDLTAEPDSFRCPICGVDKSKFKKGGN